MGTCGVLGSTHPVASPASARTAGRQALLKQVGLHEDDQARLPACGLGMQGSFRGGVGGMQCVSHYEYSSLGAPKPEGSGKEESQ